MHPAVEKAKAEVRKILVIAVFFAIGFCIIDLHNRLLVQGSQIQIASYARALVGGLIAAKVLLTVDMLPLVDAFLTNRWSTTLDGRPVSMRWERWVSSMPSRS